MHLFEKKMGLRRGAVVNICFTCVFPLVAFRVAMGLSCKKNHFNPLKIGVIRG